jgi:hypothetical protein
MVLAAALTIAVSRKAQGQQAGEIQQPKGTWQVPGEIQQPKGPWLTPGAIQCQKEFKR